ncbi:hypothetical protein [Nannocystis pusilla]|uniref:hypothetical protein n=1 Tax=Nannocystis pusilla TaxID=889268 RepID=UPI003DA30832
MPTPPAPGPAPEPATSAPLGTEASPPAAPAPAPVPAPAPAQPYAQPPPQPAQPYPTAQPYGSPPTPTYPPPATTPPPLAAEGPAQAPESVTHRKLVFANLYGLSFSIFSPIPSGDFTFFLGTNLRPRKNRARTFDWNTALGYQLTLSVGWADTPTFGLSPIDFQGIFVHRHHFTAMGYGGKNQRLFYSMGGGVMFALTEVAGVEGEGRLGYVFTNPANRVKGMVGGQARLTAAFGGVPLLQLGPFIGFMAF